MVFLIVILIICSISVDANPQFGTRGFGVGGGGLLGGGIGYGLGGIGLNRLSNARQGYGNGAAGHGLSDAYAANGQSGELGARHKNLRDHGLAAGGATRGAGLAGRDAGYNNEDFQNLLQKEQTGRTIRWGDAASDSGSAGGFGAALANLLDANGFGAGNGAFGMGLAGGLSDASNLYGGGRSNSGVGRASGVTDQRGGIGYPLIG